MKLGGQGGGGARARGWRPSDGYAMAALLVGMSIMAILMGAALPVWNKQAQREREEEYLFRAHQYARAVMKFRQRIANTNPPSVDVLVEQRFLRKKYKDPITGEDFQLVYQTAAAGIQPGGPGSATPGTIGPIGAKPPGPGGAATAPGGASPFGTGGASPFGTGGTSQSGKGGTSTLGTGGTSTAGTGGTSTAGTGGTPTSGSGAPVPGAGIIGVVSKSKATSIKIYNGRTRYDQWAVTYQDVKPGKGLPPDLLQALNLSAAAAAAGAAPGRAPAGNPFGGGAGQQPGGMNPFAPGGGQNPFGGPGAASPFGTPGGQNPFGGGGFGQPVPPQPGGQPPPPGAPAITPAYPPPPGFGAGGSLFGPPPKKG